MAESGVPLNEGISFAAIGTTALKHRRRIALWMLGGLTVATLIGLMKAPLYLAAASFLPQGSDPGRAGLASLAGEFGLALPTGNQMLSPYLYAELAESPVLLRQIVRDTLTVSELGAKRIPFLDLFEVKGASAKVREQQGVLLLNRMVQTSVVKSTGVVRMTIQTQWPSVSLAIITRIVDQINDFNQRTRQGQAAAERRFVEGRLVVARSDLRAAEDRLQQFLQSNKELSSPQVSFERDRLQRDVVLRQQVFTTLTQSLEDARIREVRDVPVITMIEEPNVGALPQPRGRISGLILGLVAGAMFGLLLSVLSETVARRRKRGDADLEEFVGALSQVKRDTIGKFRRSSGTG
jgi:uncharacterized protein involved in exopolysaccharide biosynthesis